ncbi:hypothetical protein [Azospirillum sp. SYSU D00513]|uniref:hypothetical protein n=1 Tax=Azospirillum sp. SYSU D00513 TaxID=2812561 RepID=UPI001A9795BD|nr:hypothetical protein [Azospirillum sp. SYSU D00513]
MLSNVIQTPSRPAAFSPVWYVPGDDFPMCDPRADREALASWCASPDTHVQGHRWLIAVVKVRRRVKNVATGRRVTRDWNIGHFLIWENGTSPTLDRTIMRQILDEARDAGIDEIIAHGRLCTYSQASVRFEQFGVRRPDEVVQA